MGEDGPQAEMKRQTSMSPRHQAPQHVPQESDTQSRTGPQKQRRSKSFTTPRPADFSLNTVLGLPTCPVAALPTRGMAGGAVATPGSGESGPQVGKEGPWLERGTDGVGGTSGQGSCSGPSSQGDREDTGLGRGPSCRERGRVGLALQPRILPAHVGTESSRFQGFRRAFCCSANPLEILRER